MKRLHTALLPGFARSKDSEKVSVKRGAEQRGATTRLCVEARRCQRRDHRARTTSHQRMRLLWPSITQATTDQPGGAAGKLSAPAQAQCSVSPTRHRPSVDSRIRLLHRVEFWHHDPESPIVFALLALGSHPPQLPDRNLPTDIAEEPDMCGLRCCCGLDD